MEVLKCCQLEQVNQIFMGLIISLEKYAVNFQVAILPAIL